MEEYFEQIDEQISDEQHIVTYKSLCLNLAIDLQKSKQILDRYFESRKSNLNLSACQLITGFTENGKLQIELINYDDFEEKSKSYKKVLSSHLYSVQKAKVKSSSSLYNVDYEATKSATSSGQNYGRLKYADSKKLSPEEVEAARQELQNNRSNRDNSVQQFPKSFMQKTPTQKNKSFGLFTSKPKPVSVSAEPAEEKSKETAASKTTDSSGGKKGKKSKSGMMGFVTSERTDPFANSQKSFGGSQNKGNKKIKEEQIDDVFLDDVLTSLSNKKSPQKKPSNEVPDDVLRENNEAEKVCKASNSPKKSFTKEKKKSIKKEKPDKESDEKEEIKNKKEASKKSSKESYASQKKENSSKQSTKTSETKRKLASKSKKTAAKGENPTKRRRIVMESSSSESDEDCGRMDVDEPPPSSPQQSPATSSLIKVGNKVKKRVLKSRSYQEEDGTLITEKYFSEESCSDCEEDEKKDDKASQSVASSQPVEKKPAPFFSKTSSVVGNKKKKQMSLTSFFGKKP